MGKPRKMITALFRFLSLRDLVRSFWLLFFFLAIWTLGALGFMHSENLSFFSFGCWYKSLQLFVLNYTTPEGASVNGLLQFARYAAPLFVSFSFILTKSQPLREFTSILRQRRKPDQRIIVIGYGAVGQAVARRFAGNKTGTAKGRVTAVDRRPDTPLQDLARTDGVLLIGGDGVSENMLQRIAPHKARHIYLALADDMATLDAANAVRLFLAKQQSPSTSQQPTIRALLRDSDIERRITDGSVSGALFRQWISTYSMPQMAAEELCRVARFDRLALEAGQPRAHLVIFGCGKQGDAIAMEGILTLWRNALAPPKITVFDKMGSAIEARWQQMAPALFSPHSETAKSIPKSSRPDIRFYNFKLGLGKPWPDLACEPQVTAYIFATGDDTTNLKSALTLETAMLRRQIDAAPIFIRLWNGNRGDTADPGFGPLSLIRPFGSLENVVETGEAFKDDPDAMAKALHARYLATGTTMQQAHENFTFQDDAWSVLPETYRISNRRLQRHSTQKLEDLGFQWRMTKDALPYVPEEWFKDFAKVDDLLDHEKLTLLNLPNNWTRSEHLGQELSPLTNLADCIRRASITEHDRWMADRALEGWCATVRCEARLRDNIRRLHHNLWPWDMLHPATRRWDTIFLRALVDSAQARGTDPHGSEVRAWKKHVVAVRFSLITKDSLDAIPCWDVVIVNPGNYAPTELTLTIDCPSHLRTILGTPCPTAHTCHGSSSCISLIQDAAKAELMALLATDSWKSHLCRLRFIFETPPTDHVLAIAQAVAEAAAQNALEVSATWRWSAPTESAQCP